MSDDYLLYAARTSGKKAALAGKRRSDNPHRQWLIRFSVKADQHDRYSQGRQANAWDAGFDEQKQRREWLAPLIRAACGKLVKQMQKGIDYVRRRFH